ncbi:MAG: hypothetical protein HYY24_19800 [Verrucomicrobia bacterium]|nr:hypothetical protein [Verrucomicrobiota bacterium]
MSQPPFTDLDAAPATVKPYAYPLDEFYLAAGLPLPLLEPVPSEAVPEPFKTLLVHENDMTPTLEAFHGGEIHLQVLRSYIKGGFYFREVVLRLDRSEEPVEFGASRINLNGLTCTARRLILEEHLPLGRILRDFKIPHQNHPEVFLRVESDAFINRAFGLSDRQILYGRHNLMVDLQQRPLSEIIEILPPLLPETLSRIQAVARTPHPDPLPIRMGRGSSPPGASDGH